MLSFRKHLFFAVFAGILFTTMLTAAFAQKIAPHIDEASLMITVRELCHEKYAGRLPGHDGYNKAAGWMADQFRKAGLRPGAGKGYMQPLKAEYNEIAAPCRFTIYAPGQKEIHPKLGTDYTFRGFTGTGDLTAPVVFAGYGISDETLAYNDYLGVNVAGKVVMVFRTNPLWKPAGQSWPDDSPRYKAAMARRHGALAMLLVSPPGDRETVPEVIGSVINGRGLQDESFPQLVISRATANALLRSSGLTIQELFQQIQSAQMPASMPTQTSVQITVNTRYTLSAPTFNVVGLIPGTHPQLKHEYVVVGAHLDHVGQQCGEVTFPGANDNASGSAAVLEMARAFNRMRVKPARSVIFALFASEEQGLQGAEHFVKTFPGGTDKIAAMLNFDCIAFGDSIQLGNGHSVPVLYNLARGLAADRNVVKATWSGGGADATPFHKAGVPALYFVSTNSYAHLHSPGDTPESLNTSLFADITRLGLLTLLKIAAGDYRREPVK